MPEEVYLLIVQLDGKIVFDDTGGSVWLFRHLEDACACWEVVAHSLKGGGGNAEGLIFSTIVIEAGEEHGTTGM